MTRESIETAYSFFHQKWRVYQYSSLDWQCDDIECAIAGYTEQMNVQLYQWLADGRPDFLRQHATFASDLQEAIGRMEQMLF